MSTIVLLARDSSTTKLRNNGFAQRFGCGGVTPALSLLEAIRDSFKAASPSALALSGSMNERRMAARKRKELANLIHLSTSPW